MPTRSKLVTDPHFRNRRKVFRDRSHAGAMLAPLLEALRGTDATVLAIPAGGVPVALPLAAKLGLDVGVAAVSKITLPRNSEVGFGAVAFDGTVQINDSVVRAAGLTEREVEDGIAMTREKVERRAGRFRAFAGKDVRNRTAILVDDGLASGFTMKVALAAMREAGAKKTAVAVPTAHETAAYALATEADVLYCANLRGGHPFAVADAYDRWHDVGEDEAVSMMEQG